MSVLGRSIAAGSAIPSRTTPLLSIRGPACPAKLFKSRNPATKTMKDQESE